MAEAVYTQILAGVQARLLTIIGDGGTTYWTTPHAVVVSPALTMKCLQSGLGGAVETDPATIYVLSPGPEEKAGGTIGRNGTQRGVMTLDFSLCQFFPANEDPHNPPVPDRVTVQSRMMRDVEKALLKDQADGVTVLFGVTGCVGIEVSAADRTAEATWEEYWALAFLRAEISYFYPVSTP